MAGAAAVAAVVVVVVEAGMGRRLQRWQTERLVLTAATRTNKEVGEIIFADAARHMSRVTSDVGLSFM